MIFRVFICFWISCYAWAQSSKNLQWFSDARFGLFINWTLDYEPQDPESVARSLENVKKEANKFDASMFQPKEWAKTFKEWGVRYVIITAKSRVGFTLFESPVFDLDAKKATPARRDLLKEFTEAMRAEGIKIGFQYSLADYSHPFYHAVRKEDGKVKVDYFNWSQYLEKLQAELKHLCTAYGKIDILWLDGAEERPIGFWQKEDILSIVQQHQPHLLMNNPFNLSGFGDYKTIRAGDSIRAVLSEGVVWEYYFPLGFAWRGAQAETHIKPAYELVRIFEDVAKRGGNLLINIYADYHGNISQEQRKSIAAFASWMKQNEEAVYNVTPISVAGVFNGSINKRGNILYLIAFENSRNELLIKGLQNEVEEIVHLKTGQKLSWRQSADVTQFNQKGWIYFKLPAELEDSIATVVTVKLKSSKLMIRGHDGKLYEWN
ncbi:MAG: alpha-L-fucosidase [Cytophagales bacterium]|nr:alpha-L-fucosidase [Cytophagales bacterium]MDW8384781.1 alpha-L-fucosidase [Flammeovirgaceae bacterium]